MSFQWKVVITCKHNIIWSNDIVKNIYYGFQSITWWSRCKDLEKIGSVKNNIENRPWMSKLCPFEERQKTKSQGAMCQSKVGPHCDWKKCSE